MFALALKKRMSRHFKCLHACPRGDPGFRGPDGFQGSEGQPGMNGDKGSQGQAGADASTVGLVCYAEYFTRLEPADEKLVITAGSPLSFFQTGVAPPNGLISRVLVTDHQFVLQPGTYRISWRVPTSFPATLQLNADGDPIPSTITGSNQSCEITNTVLFFTPKETTISLVNPGDEFEIPTSSDGVTSLTYNLVIIYLYSNPD